MYTNIDILITNLYLHAENYDQGKTQDFSKVCEDCRLAADMLKNLKASKHTQKRARQRLSKKNREKTKRIACLVDELEQLKLNGI